MAGVLGIYGLIIAVIIANAVSGVDGGRPAYGQLCALARARSPAPRPQRPHQPLRLPRIGCRSLRLAPLSHARLRFACSSAMAHFGGGLACGLSGLAAGLAIGIVGDSMTRASAEQPKLFVGMVLILIFAEALGLYGLIVGLILASKA
jgi:F0F1-type ATP synthase membrane subunit c/vacuolar-type H+-ATPase subunit K